MKVILAKTAAHFSNWTAGKKRFAKVAGGLLIVIVAWGAGHDAAIVKEHEKEPLQVSASLTDFPCEEDEFADLNNNCYHIDDVAPGFQLKPQR